MEPAQAITLAIQVTSIVVLTAMGLILYRALQVEPVFRGRPGGNLMKLIIGVIVGFTISQAIAVLNVFGILVIGTGEINGLHNGIRLLQQIVIISTCIWAWRRLSNFI